MRMCVCVDVCYTVNKFVLMCENMPAARPALKWSICKHVFAVLKHIGSRTFMFVYLCMCVWPCGECIRQISFVWRSVVVCAL